MPYRVYKVNAEEVLTEVARKFNITPQVLKSLNPGMRVISPILGIGKEWIGHGQEIMVPDVTISEAREEVKKLNFKKIARYRCSQINITKALDDVTFSSNIKTQYLLSNAQAEEEDYFHVVLEDYIFQISPKELSVSFDLVKPVESIRNNVKFTQNKRAEFKRIVNLFEIEEHWNSFKKNELPQIEFYKRLKNQSEEAAVDFLNSAISEFSDEKVYMDTLNKNLFYHILLKANVRDELSDFSFTQYSQLFPKQNLNIVVRKEKVSEDVNTTMFTLTGSLQNEKLSEAELITQYDEIYKPMLKYSFTSFDFTYKITYTIHTKSGVLLNAMAVLNESVKNNFETITQFELKQIEL